MTADDPAPSARKAELLEHAYRYALDHGLADISLRPLATAVGSSPRVLLYLFGSKEGLVRALLARARTDELAMLGQVGPLGGQPDGLVIAAQQVWSWLATQEHRSLLALWVEGYARSLIEPDGPWGRFAQTTVEDWLAVLARAQPASHRRSSAGRAQRTMVLAVLRGAMLDLLATGDVERTTAAVHMNLRMVAPTTRSDD